MRIVNILLLRNGANKSIGITTKGKQIDVKDRSSNTIRLWLNFKFQTFIWLIIHREDLSKK